MNKINLILPDSAVTGKQVSFIAPCGSDNTECIVINNVDYIICDAAGNNLAGIVDIWTNGAFVSVILDVNLARAYIQNANTNRYIEGKFDEYTNAIAQIQDYVVSGNGVRDGNTWTLNMLLASGATDVVKLEFDENGLISSVNANGRVIPWTFTGV